MVATLRGGAANGSSDFLRNAFAYKNLDPAVSALYLRHFCEQLVRLVAENEAMPSAPEGETLFELLKRLEPLLPKRILKNCHLLREIGNIAAHQHSGKTITEDLLINALERASYLEGWYVEHYGTGLLPARESVAEPRPLLSSTFTRVNVRNVEWSTIAGSLAICFVIFALIGLAYVERFNGFANDPASASEATQVAPVIRTSQRVGLSVHSTSVLSSFHDAFNEGKLKPDLFDGRVVQFLFQDGAWPESGRVAIRPELVSSVPASSP